MVWNDACMLAGSRKESPSKLPSSIQYYCFSPLHILSDSSTCTNHKHPGEKCACSWWIISRKPEPELGVLEPTIFQGSRWSWNPKEIICWSQNRNQFLALIRTSTLTRPLSLPFPFLHFKITKSGAETTFLVQPEPSRMFCRSWRQNLISIISQSWSQFHEFYSGN